MAHVQFTSEQRYQIKALLQANQKPTKMAEIIGVARSTIYRELKRNTGLRGYRPKQAHEKALGRRQGKSKERLGPETWEQIEEKLRLDWSPEQIANWFKKQGHVTVSHEWIYQHVYADKRVGAAYINTCAAKNHTESEQDAMTAEEKSQIQPALSNGQVLWNSGFD